MWLVAGLGVLVSPTPGARGAAGTIRFEPPSAAAVGFTLENAMTPDKPMIGSVLGGLALLDYDQDGFLDIYFTNGAAIPSLAKSDSRYWNRLYHNNRDGTFSDVTERAAVAGTGYDMGVAAGDYDNDGDPDLFVAGVNHNTLYRNNRDGTFADVTREAGVTGASPAGKKPWSVGAAWLDYDKDGKLDLFVSNYLDWSFETARTCGPAGQRVSC
ncbi:MAG: VCBS repeat-containing protein, partial [Mycetocola sp.]